MLKYALSFILLMAFMAPAVGGAAAEDAAPPRPVPFVCKNYQGIKIKVIPSLGHVKRDLTLRAVDLASRDAWGELMVDHIASKSELSSDMRFDHIRSKEIYETCVVLDEITILHKFEVTSRLLNNYPEGSCEYEQVKLHEERHIALAKEFLERSSELIQNYVASASETMGMLVEPYRTNHAEAYLGQTMNNALLDLQAQLDRQHWKIQQQTLDTPEEKAAIFAACPSWKAPTER